MAYVRALNCCGVGELCDYESGDERKVKQLIEDASSSNHGFLVAYFVKEPGEKKFNNEPFMKALINHGFKKSSRKFINPNTGNILQPLHYLMKKKERAPTQRPEVWY